MARVPTCPEWTVRDLLAHQTMVHRWATAHVRGDDPDAMPNPDTDPRGGARPAPRSTRMGWRRCSRPLCATRLPDLVAMTFLKDAPAATRVLGSPPGARDDDPRRRCASGRPRPHAVDRRGRARHGVRCRRHRRAAARILHAGAASRALDGEHRVVVRGRAEATSERRWVRPRRGAADRRSGDDDAPDADSRAHRHRRGALPHAVEPRRRGRGRRHRSTCSTGGTPPNASAGPDTGSRPSCRAWASRATRTRRCRRSSWRARRHREDRRART